MVEHLTLDDLRKRLGKAHGRVSIMGREYVRSHYVHPVWVDASTFSIETTNQLVDAIEQTTIRQGTIRDTVIIPFEQLA